MSDQERALLIMRTALEAVATHQELRISDNTYRLSGLARMARRALKNAQAALKGKP